MVINKKFKFVTLIMIQTKAITKSKVGRSISTAPPRRVCFLYLIVS